MAIRRQVIVTRASDLSGEESEGVRTIAFALDGRKAKLDLTPGEVAELEGVLARYFDAADTAAADNGGNTSDDETPAIRQWGRDHGYDVQERGKLSASLKAAYYAAQDKAGNVDESTENVKAAKGK